MLSMALGEEACIPCSHESSMRERARNGGLVMCPLTLILTLTLALALALALTLTERAGKEVWSCLLWPRHWIWPSIQPAPYPNPIPNPIRNPYPNPTPNPYPNPNPTFLSKPWPSMGLVTSSNSTPAWPRKDRWRHLRHLR